jgi:poly(A) polymerase
MDNVLETQAGSLAITRKLAGDIRELWMMQPRFERRAGKAPYRLVEQPRYRAGWDFLSLRAKAGEVPEELPRWWQRFVHGSEAERAALLQEARTAGEAPAKRKRRRRPRKAKSVESETITVTPTPDAP